MHIPESIFKQARYDVPGADPDNPAPASATFAYDPMGNRTHFEDRHLPATTYSANALNQYTSISGSAPTYDLDGNLTRRNHQNLVWDAENRLIEVAPTLPTADDTRVRYAYDPTGRRVRRTVHTYDGTTWSTTSDTHYTYWNWNVIEEHRDIAGASDETRRYFWGEDLSGSFQGAGGVGGLLTTEANGIRWCFHYDGNGNVTELTDNSGSVVASYRYTAFGKLRSSSGPAAEENEYRFSTKPYDEISQCYYYGYRFYNPEMGRWLNRDPIAERGGVNLYGFVGNDGVNSYDVLGNVPSWKRCQSPEVWTSDPNGSKLPEDGCSAPKWLPGNKDNPGWLLDADFKVACDSHDLCYNDCSSNRRSCDQSFQNAMLAVCDSKYSWWDPQRKRCLDWAQKYYRAVRIFAGINNAYRNRQEAACHCACP